MGGLDSAAAAAATPATTAARLVADVYMAAPANVATAPATATAAVGPVSYIVWTYFVPTCMDLYGLDLYGLDLYLWLSMNETRVYLHLCIFG